MKLHRSTWILVFITIAYTSFSLCLVARIYLENCKKIKKIPTIHYYTVWCTSYTSLRSLKSCQYRCLVFFTLYNLQKKKRPEKNIDVMSFSAFENMRKYEKILIVLYFCKARVICYQQNINLQKHFNILKFWSYFCLYFTFFKFSN